MRRLLLLLFVFISFRGNSQQNRFVYFQAAANEPFYIRMDEKTFSSNAFGSLVIGKLKDSTYKLYIGFPRNKSSEQLFQVPVAGSDRGFELKRGADGSIRLFDWQKMSYIEPAARPVKAAETPTQAKTDTYSRLMAAVVDDPAVATIAITPPVQETATAKADTHTSLSNGQNGQVSSSAGTVTTIAKEPQKNVEPPKTDTIRPVKQDVILPATTASATSSAEVAAIGAAGPDTAKSTKDTTKTVATRNEDTLKRSDAVIPPAQATEHISTILTLSDSVKETYRELVFIDRNETSSDTINIIIPIEVQLSKPVDTGLYRVKETSTDTTRSATAVQLVNSDCNRFASDSDVDKLRVAILNANSNDTKVMEAKKVFKTRCVTTKQIRALSELFSSDDGRYKLFDAAYPYIYDSSNFRTLVDLLEDSFYVNRFKTLARIQD